MGWPGEGVQGATSFGNESTYEAVVKRRERWCHSRRWFATLSAKSNSCVHCDHDS